MKTRDHGGGLDAAIKKYGGTRESWIDLSTGINPVPYQYSTFTADAWTALPDQKSFKDLEQAARRFWNVPNNATVLAAPGASSLIARIPSVLHGSDYSISEPTYNEHAASFETAGWDRASHAKVQVVVHPNNPDGRIWEASELTSEITIIDESFCDIAPDQSHIALAGQPNTIILKSFGKFWGLAGLRLGFAIGDPKIVNCLADTLGPWQISGPALQIGKAALCDQSWAINTRLRLNKDAQKLDNLLASNNAKPLGGTTLFRLYEVDDALEWQVRLAQNQIWSRVFPYAKTWIRLGLPHPDHWSRLSDAL